MPAADLTARASSAADECLYAQRDDCPTLPELLRAISALHHSPETEPTQPAAQRRLAEAHRAHDDHHRMQLLADDVRHQLAQHAAEDYDQAFAAGQRHAYLRVINILTELGIIAVRADNRAEPVTESIGKRLADPDPKRHHRFTQTGRRDQQDAIAYAEALAEAWQNGITEQPPPEPPLPPTITMLNT